MGVTGAAVYRSVDNANDVTVTHDFKSADKAKEFASSERLKAVMEAYKTRFQQKSVGLITRDSCAAF